MNQKSNLFGLILAGGQSRRMGKPKAFIEYHGIPQVTYLFNLLSKYCQKVYTACKHHQRFDENLNPLPDQFEMDTPLNGILSAFKKYPEKSWLTVPVDMPLIDDVLLNHLITHRDKSKSATCYFDSTGKKPEPLLCIWEAKVFEQLQAYYKSGGYKPRQLLQQIDARLLEIPDKKYHLNVNSPEELAAFQKNQLK